MIRNFQIIYVYMSFLGQSLASFVYMYFPYNYIFTCLYKTIKRYGYSRRLDETFRRNAQNGRFNDETR